jgi:hypothetical protein
MLNRVRFKRVGMPATVSLTDYVKTHGIGSYAWSGMYTPTVPRFELVFSYWNIKDHRCCPYLTGPQSKFQG